MIDGEFLELPDSNRFVVVDTGATRLTAVRTDGSRDAWKRVAVQDDFQGFLRVFLSDGMDVSGNILMNRTRVHAGRCDTIKLLQRPVGFGRFAGIIRFLIAGVRFRVLSCTSQVRFSIGG